MNRKKNKIKNSPSILRNKSLSNWLGPNKVKQKIETAFNFNLEIPSKFIPLVVRAKPYS